MNVMHNLLLYTFGRPEGIMGRVGGIVMARTNRKCAAWVTDLLEIKPNDKVLEVGFGPGVGIELLAKAIPAGEISGVDFSVEMVDQAIARNKQAIEKGRVNLRHGSVECLPYEGNSFDKALAINSLQMWSHPTTSLREMGRVLTTDGSIALGFTPYAGQSKSGLSELLTAAGFIDVKVVESVLGFCALAVKP